MTTANHERDAEKKGSEASRQPSNVLWITLGLRALMETGVVIGLGYWGYQTGPGVPAKVALAIVAPLLGFGFWGTVDFHQAGRAAESLRLAQELIVSGLAALAVWSAGQPTLGLVMALLSILYHALVYATGGRLLKPRPQTG
jgi:Protein of unknown function (DUF2568)